MARILVVEDEEALRVLAQSILEDMGHETVNAATAEEALAFIANEGFALLFTDIWLGDGLHAGIKLAEDEASEPNNHGGVPALRL